MAENKLEFATLGGGCFWCLEAVFEQVRGVESVISGYCGGAIEYPSYRQICEGQTGHAEVVRLGFDPEAVCYRDLLDVFFAIHNPTTLNRQEGDIGSQYRSVIFFHSPEQRTIAESLLGELGEADSWSAPIVTQLLPVPNFYPAESYHQHYFSTNPGQPYCQFVVSPKLYTFRQSFAERLKLKPVL